MTQLEISAILEAIAPPGEAREQKVEAVKQAYLSTGNNSQNLQGYHVWDDLEAYPQY